MVCANEIVNDSVAEAQDNCDSKLNEQTNDIVSLNETQTDNVDDTDRETILTNNNNNENDAIDQIESAQDNAEVEVTANDEEVLTFDENHFSTPIGGVTPEQTTPRDRRRRQITTSSVDDSEVRDSGDCVKCVT